MLGYLAADCQLVLMGYPLVADFLAVLEVVVFPEVWVAADCQLVLMDYPLAAVDVPPVRVGQAVLT